MVTALYPALSPNCGTPSVMTWTPLASVTGVAMPKNSRKPGISFALAMTSSTPPAVTQPTVTTTTRAIIMTTACMKSLALSARKPPMIV